MGLRMRIIVNVSENHLSCMIQCDSVFMQAEITQILTFHGTDYNNGILLKRPISARRDETSHITSPLIVYFIFSSFSWTFSLKIKM